MRQIAMKPSVSNKVKELSKEVMVGIHDESKEAPAGKLKTHSGNIDGLTFQIAILMVVFCCGLLYAFAIVLKGIDCRGHNRIFHTNEILSYHKK